MREALKVLTQAFHTYRCPAEEVPIENALNRILAENITSKRNVPHYTASAVDGYAVYAAETARATRATPIHLPPERLSWVNTGMPVQNADAVLMVEDSSEPAEGGISVFKSLTQGENVRAVGEDVMNGQMIAIRGDRITLALISLFLCAGIRTVRVWARPRTIFIPTGNEIMDRDYWFANESIPPGVVVNSNAEFVRAQFAAWGFEIDLHPILPDDPDLIEEAVRKATDRYDIVLVSAGSAKGRRDHSADIFSKLGDMLFRYVRMKPGRPAMAAQINGRPAICTPGFPMSCVVTLWTFVYPLLKQFSGEATPEDYISDAIGASAATEAALMVQHSSAQGIAEWVRMKMAEIDGKRFCWPLSAGASVLWALAESDGIALFSENALEHRKGTPIPIRTTRKIDFSKRILFQGSDDPAIQRLLPFLRDHGFELVIRAVGSMGGLAALGRGEAHIAAAHLFDPDTASYNDAYIDRFSQGRNWERRLVFFREQGLIVQSGNPKNIRSVTDLANGQIAFENRQPGAGTRVLFDFMLKENNLTSSAIAGYERQSTTHMEAANKVASGVADATLGIKAAADALGLGFIPVAHEPYELVFSETFPAHPAYRALLEILDGAEWRDAVERMGGYEWAK